MSKEINAMWFQRVSGGLGISETNPQSGLVRLIPKVD